MNIVNRLPELIKAKQTEYKEKNDKDLSEVEIAVAIGVNPATLSRYKNAKVDSVNWDVWRKLCDYFGVEGHEIFDIQRTAVPQEHKRNTRGKS